ncbi:MAG: LptE family protein [Chlorobi bacterium]|nr:LptE family protein [Chlorobiota bacterium]
MRFVKQHIKVWMIIGVIFTINTVVMSSCKVSYSFSGASISPDIKTVSVLYFENRVQRGSTVNPSLSQDFTEALRDKMKSQTSLNLVEEDGDVQFEGEFTTYKIAPLAITGNQAAALNRFTVTVRVKFTNQIDPKQDFDTSFSRYEDYPSTQNFEDVEQDLLEKIIADLTEDVFNRAFVNW